MSNYKKKLTKYTNKINNLDHCVNISFIKDITNLYKNICNPLSQKEISTYIDDNIKIINEYILLNHLILYLFEDLKYKFVLLSDNFKSELVLKPILNKLLVKNFSFGNDENFIKEINCNIIFFINKL